MTDFLGADIKVQESAPQLNTVASSPTAVVGLVGVTERGPFGPRLTTSWDEWNELYGGYVANGDAAQAAFGFFKNGGRFLWTVRAVHMTDPTDPNSRISAASSGNLATTGADTQGEVETTNAEPFTLLPGGTLEFEKDAVAEPVVTLAAAQAQVDGSGGSFPTGFAGAENIVVDIDNSGVNQQIDFTASHQTLLEVLAEINAALVGGSAEDDGSGELRIQSDKFGTASDVEIVSGSANALAAFGMTAAQTDAGSGDYADSGAVTAAEVKAKVEAVTAIEAEIQVSGKIKFKTPTVGTTGSVQVLSASTLDDALYLGLDNAVHQGTDAGAANTATAQAKTHGAWGDGLQVVIAAANSGDADEFKWQTVLNGVVQETFDNLITTLAAVRNWETILNDVNTGSGLVTLTDLLAGAPPTNRPTNGTYSLSGGSDGLVGLADADFVGDSAGPTGIYELDEVEDLSLLIIPGRATSYVHQEMITYCEVHRGRQPLAILDPPQNYSATQIRDYVRITANIFELSEMGAMYWPRVKVQNPDDSVFTSDENGLVVVPPSGHVAGVMARTDNNFNVHQPPAGVERGILYGVLDFETRDVLKQAHRDIVYPANINPLTTWSGAPIHIDGNRCLKTSGNWGYVSERRGMSYIERQIKLLLAFARHSNNDRALRRRAKRTLDVFLIGQTDAGAFRYKDPDLAFFVDFSDALNPESIVLAHKLKGRVGVRKAKSTDWVIIEVFEDLSLLDTEISG